MAPETESRRSSKVRFSFDENTQELDQSRKSHEFYKPALTPHPRVSNIDPFDEACASEVGSEQHQHPSDTPGWLERPADPKTPGSVFDSPDEVVVEQRRASIQPQDGPMKLHLPERRSTTPALNLRLKESGPNPALPALARTANHMNANNRTGASPIGTPNTPTLPPSYVRSPLQPNFTSPRAPYSPRNFTSPRQAGFPQSPALPFTPYSPGKHNSDDTLYSAGWNVDMEKHAAYDMEAGQPDPAQFPIQGGAAPPPLKPALRRGTTEEQVRRQPAREAVDLVDKIRHAGLNDEEDSGGVLSHLLRLHALQSKKEKAPLGDDMSRTSSTESAESRAGGDSRLRRRRAGSDCSIATTVNYHELDPHDPRCDPNYQKQSRRKKGWGRRRASSWVENKVVDQMDGKEKDDSDGKEKASKSKKERLRITASVATILQKQQFILKLAKALMTYGSPSHRLEAQLSATAHALNVDAQFLHLPSILIASFGDPDTRTSETTFIKAGGDLNLGSVHKTHEIYRSVLHGDMQVAEGTAALVSLLKSKPIYSPWIRIVLAASLAGIIGPLGFGGSLLDGVASFVFGASFAWLQMRVAAKSASYANIFEISCTCIIAFLARALAQTGVFCYQSLVSAGVVGLLPGYIILCGSLDLASRHIISGAVKMVFAIIYALFLGFGVAVGSDVYLLIDANARNVAVNHAKQAGTEITGTFLSNTTNGAITNWTGTFVFSNSTAGAQADLLAAASMFCNRAADLPWWRTTLPWWAQFILVPIFASLLSLANMSPIRSREFPVMVIIGCVGWATNTAANKFIFDRSDVVSFIGAMVIGLLGNIYSRVFRGTAFTAMATGVLFLVPAGISAAGGIGTTSMNAAGDSYTNGLTIGFRMIQVSIGITVGLFFSSFIVYNFGHSHKGNAIFAF